MVKKRLGKEYIFKGMFNILCIYYGNDFSEFFGVMGNYNFDILGVDNIDVGCGNLIIKQFDFLIVELDYGFFIYFVDLFRFGLLYNFNLFLLNIDDNVLLDINVFILCRFIRERNKFDRYGEWVMGFQLVEVWYV